MNPVGDPAIAYNPYIPKLEVPMPKELTDIEELQKKIIEWGRQLTSGLQDSFQDSFDEDVDLLDDPQRPPMPELMIENRE